MRLLGANAQPHIEGLEQLPGKVNYFLGNDPSRWRTNVPTYSKVKYEQVYPGVGMGWTTSTDFPVTTEAYDTAANGDADVFVAKISEARSTAITINTVTQLLGATDVRWVQDRPLYSEILQGSEPRGHPADLQVKYIRI